MGFLIGYILLQIGALAFYLPIMSAAKKADE